MKAFRKIVSNWAHKKEGMILLHRKQHLFLRAKEDLREDQAQERAMIGARLPELEEAWQLKEALPFAAEGPCMNAGGWKPRRRQAEKPLDRKSRVWYSCSNKAP
jgi:hypothetical protein